MSIGFVLGNGLSRKVIRFSQLEGKGKIYGCNALYREFTPDVLVATDRPIATEIQKSGYALKNRFYTRYPIAGYGAERIPMKYFGFSSGPIALSFAAAECDIIFLLGFDLGSPPNSKQFNNIYAGTEFYKKPTDAPTFGGNWNKQIIKVAEAFPNTAFFRVEDRAFSAPFQLSGPLTNVSTMRLSEFLERLNKL